jgi:hypothetical protein
MDEMRIKLSALWVALMLTYLLGDVLRIFSGDMKPGEMMGVQATQGMFLGAAILLVLPIAGASDCDGFPFPDFESACESLGKHHPSHSPLSLQSRWIAYILFPL